MMPQIKIGVKTLQRFLVSILTLVVLIGSAWAFVEVFVPWAPRETYLIATDNSIARFTTELVTLQSLHRTATSSKEKEYLFREIERIRREIRKFEAKQKKYIK